MNTCNCWRDSLPFCKIADFEICCRQIPLNSRFAKPSAPQKSSFCAAKRQTDMSFAANFARVVNCQPVALAAVPEHPVERFTELLAEQLAVPGTVLSALYGAPDDQQEIRL